jgi:phosphatidate phosphatase APP1
MFGNIRRALRGILHLLARPATADRGRGGLVIQPYRGYGYRTEIFLMGRIFRQQEAPVTTGAGTLGRDLLDLGRRLVRRGEGGAELAARFGGTEKRLTADADGYFRVHMRLAQPPGADRLWHRLELELLRHGAGSRALGELFVPPAGARFVVISDIDDTVMYTGVANKLKMIWRLFLQGARSRVAFPGVAAFYRALHEDETGAPLNPILYVSRAPWSLYEVLEEFFQRHRIPVGPILFLREWGLTLHRPFPRRAREHKLALLRDMLALYADLPFVLIGDSGQRDPEIYARAVHEHPGRVLAVYIRNVNRGDGRRRREIEHLAREVAAAGSTLLLAADTFAMAEHAAERGLIAWAALSEVRGERLAEEGTAGRRPTRVVERPSPGETEAAVAAGEVGEALAAETDGKAPPNILVEPETERSGRRARSPRSPSSR